MFNLYFVDEIFQLIYAKLLSFCKSQWRNLPFTIMAVEQSIFFAILSAWAVDLFPNFNSSSGGVYPFTNLAVAGIYQLTVLAEVNLSVYSYSIGRVYQITNKHFGLIYQFTVLAVGESISLQF